MANATVDDPNTPNVDEYFAVQRQLELLGYRGPIIADALQKSPVTVVYFKPGFLEFAKVLATDLMIPVENVLPYPTAPITPITEISDDAGDLILVIGQDWPTVISITTTTSTTTTTTTIGA